MENKIIPLDQALKESTGTASAVGGIRNQQ
jgi:hypothetical protein